MKGWTKEQIASKTRRTLGQGGATCCRDYAHRFTKQSYLVVSNSGLVLCGLSLGNQKILLMDEPFSALDAISRKQLQELTKALHKEFGMTTIFVTHDTDEALKLGDQIAVLQDGEIRQVAEP